MTTQIISSEVPRDPYDDVTCFPETIVDTDKLPTIEGLPNQTNGEIQPELRCFATDDPELIDAARKLTAKVYLKRKFITEDQLDSEGRISDENDAYLNHSTYYVMLNSDNQLVAACRKIRFDPNKGVGSFPILEHYDELNPRQRKRIDDVGLENIVEISALVKDNALDPDGKSIFKLYRQLFQDAWKGDGDGPHEEAFVMACNPRLYRRLKVAFDGIIHRLGSDLDYPGQKAVPAMFSVRNGTLDYIRKSKNVLNPRALLFQKVLKFMFDGAEIASFDDNIREAFTKYGYDKMSETNERLSSDITSMPLDEKVSRKPEIIAATGLIGYTAIRTALVKFGVSPDTNVDWKAFLGIEVATTWPYAKGMGTMVRSAVNPDQFTTSQKVKAGAVATSSFMAPYAYLVAEGGNMPASAWAGMAAFILAGVGAGASKIRAARRQGAQEIVAPDATTEDLTTKE